MVTYIFTVALNFVRDALECHVKVVEVGLGPPVELEEEVEDIEGKHCLRTLR